MNRKTETAEFPYADRPMWLYSRSSDKRMFVLIQQMRNLLEEANHREYTVVGTSQDMGTGRSMARMGLKQMMRSVQGGFESDLRYELYVKGLENRFFQRAAQKGLHLPW